MELLNIDIILNEKKIIKGNNCYIPCIYFLISNNEIVYVGQTINFYGRLTAHIKNKNKIFDSYFIEKHSKSKLDDYETEYILKFRPIYNKKLPENSYYKSLPIIMRLYDIDNITVDFIIKESKLQICNFGTYIYLNEKDFAKAYIKYLKLIRTHLFTGGRYRRKKSVKRDKKISQ